MGTFRVYGGLPSGEHTKNYGKSPFLMGKSTIFNGDISGLWWFTLWWTYKKLWKITIFNGWINYKWAIFNSYVKLPEGSGVSEDAAYSHKFLNHFKRENSDRPGWFLRDPIFRQIHVFLGTFEFFSCFFFFPKGSLRKLRNDVLYGVMRICFDIHWRWQEVVHSKMIQDVWISLILLGSCLTLYVLFLSVFKSCVRSTTFFWWTLHCSFPLPIQSNCVVDSVYTVYIYIYK